MGPHVHTDVGKTMSLAESESNEFEELRCYLMMVGLAMIGHSYRGKFDTDDIVNQTLLDGFQNRSRLRQLSREEQIAWFREALANNIRDAIRYLLRDKRDIRREHAIERFDESATYIELIQLTDGLTTPGSKILRMERELLLARALGQLPEDQKQAIELHHLQGCTLMETAEEMDRTLASVAGLLRRGFAELRSILDAYEAHEE